MITRARMLEILNRGRQGDRVSRNVDFFLATLIFTNVIAICLESVDSIGTPYAAQFLVFEWFSVSIFSVEYIARLWASAERTDSKRDTAFGRRMEYVFSFSGLIDLIAILPSFISLLVGSPDLRWIRVVRMVRLLKLSNYNTALEDLGSAIYQERRSFLASLYLFTIALFAASAMMYIAENAAQPEEFASIPETMWWALITLTTVGYGDVSPVTALGKMIGAVTALMGVCTVALLTGIIANAFAGQMAQRKKIFENEIHIAMEDGVITDDEHVHIEHLQRRFNLSDEYARAIMTAIYEQEKEKNHPKG